MFLLYPLSFLAFILGCHCIELTKTTEHEIRIDEVNDDNEFIVRAIPVQERHIKDILQLGIEASEPMHHDYIEGDLGILKYQINNTDVTGVHDCKFNNVEVDKEISIIKGDVRCPRIKLTGLYEVTGKLFSLPIVGNGDFTIIADDFYVSLSAGTKKFQRKDDEMHLKIKNFSLRNMAYKKVTYRLTNLFNGNDKLSEEIHNFANNNWEAVANFAQDPIWYPSVKIILKNMNKYLKPIPLKELIFN